MVCQYQRIRSAVVGRYSRVPAVDCWSYGTWREIIEWTAGKPGARVPASITLRIHGLAYYGDGGYRRTRTLSHPHEEAHEDERLES
eukprot:1817770-Rhodomonas_salina.3